MQPVQALEVDVATVHDVESASFRNQLIEDIDVVKLPVADMDKTRDIAAQIEQRVHLHCRLGAAKRCPRKQRERQVDRGRVQGISRVGQIDAKGLVDIQLASDTNQALREVGVDAPVAGGVRIGQRIARHLTADAHVVELLGLGTQTRLDVPQALPKRQLRESHAQVLVHAGETV